MINGIPYQSVIPVDLLRTTQPMYFAPYADRSAPKNVLIIGAGTGVDVAAALAEGADHVDAVEIDPRLVKIGEDLNPDKPFQDPRVSVHVDDGRAFLERTDTKYDVIVFSLPDSLTLVTGQAGLRLESYVLTKEAIESAKQHLAPGGTFGLFGFFPADWMRDRMAGLVQDVFGKPPCLPGAIPGLSSVMVIEGPASCDQLWQPSGQVVAAPTDDRPFPYLKGTDIPAFYPLALLLMLLVSVLAVRAAGGPLGSMKSYLDLFFMGAAFLLLEAKSVVQFALLFGTTWFVNALVFAGILLVVLAGVEVARRVKIRRPLVLYPVLFASLAVAWLIPPDALLGLPLPARFVAAVVLAFTPVFIANLIFSRRFRDVNASTVAFAANLLGAILGGLLEYSALVVGYRALLILAALLYLLAYAFGRRFLGVGGELRAARAE
jgi:phospholipid N-methyltransferase